MYELIVVRSSTLVSMYLLSCTFLRIQLLRRLRCKFLSRNWKNTFYSTNVLAGSHVEQFSHLHEFSLCVFIALPPGNHDNWLHEGWPTWKPFMLQNVSLLISHFILTVKFAVFLLLPDRAWTIEDCSMQKFCIFLLYHLLSTFQWLCFIDRACWKSWISEIINFI